MVFDNDKIKVSDFMDSATINHMLRKVRNKTIKIILKKYIDSLGYIIWDGTESRSIDAINKYLKEYGHKTIIRDATNAKLEITSNIITKLIQLDNRTYLFIYHDNFRSVPNSEGTNFYGIFYIFGKHAHKYYNDILNKANTDISRSKIVSCLHCDKDGKITCNDIRSAYRKFETIYLNDGVKENIINYLDTWINNKNIYNRRGIKFKTGILLYGKPGVGKSSIVNAIASYMNCNLTMVDLSTFKYMNVSDLSKEIDSCCGGGAFTDLNVVLLDDIDTILSSRESKSITSQDKENIAKLLSLLDSPSSPNNTIFVATTNYIYLFDEAVTRAGRFDKIIKMEDISKNVAYKMCRDFGLNPEISKSILRAYDSDYVNPAILQNNILKWIKSDLNK